MGIKGRRKKQLQRLSQGGGDFASSNMSMPVDPDDIEDPELRELALAGELPPGMMPSMPKMKKSELYSMMDKDYLEQITEEHRNRKSAAQNARKKHRTEAAEDIEATIGRDDAFGDLDESAEHNPTRQGRQKQIVGPSFGHPLVGIEAPVVDALAMAGFTCMTTVQARAIPLALQSYDILGQAKTGSGKTLAFCIPIVNANFERIAKSPGTFVALVLSPTKELCAQINTVMQGLLKHLPSALGKSSFRMTSELITGGTNLKEEKKRLLACNVAIGTPGRVLDHVMHTPAWTIRTTLSHFVMDEADRLLADGFQRDLDSIIGALPAQRQTLLFSATNSKSVRELARLSMAHSPLFVSTKGDAPQSLSEGSSAPSYTDLPVATDADNTAVNEEAIPSSLQQFCQVVPMHERLRALYAFVKRVCKTRKAMVFCSTVASTQFSCMMMGAAGFHDEVLMLHGKMKHRQRLATFDAFLQWDHGVLFCTDVAARGLDIPKVDWILQFDAPTDPTEYVHRIGRTARAGASGKALLFVTPEEQGFVTYLNKFGIHMQVIPAEEVPDVQHAFHRILELDPIVAKQAQAAFRAHVAAYQSHVLTSIFDVRNLNLEDLAISYALQTVPHVTIPKATGEEKKEEYVKGKLKSLQKRANSARAEYERLKTKQQWSEDGIFVGMRPPPKAL